MKTNSLLGYRPLALAALLLAAGCAHSKPPEPKMQPGTGAISGKLVGTNQDPFDLKLAGDGGARDLRIDLVSPSSGVVAAAYPQPDNPVFVFSNVKPGSYELSVYRNIPGKRTIAGSQAVTVDADQIAPVTLTLQVTESDASSQ